MRNLSQAIGQNFVQNYRQLMRGVFTLTGKYRLFGEDWSWNAYAQNSQVRERQFARLNTLNKNYGNAIDAVVVQAAAGPRPLWRYGANAANGSGGERLFSGAAGVPIPAVGSIACRSTLTQTSYGVFTNSSGFQALNPGGYGDSVRAAGPVRRRHRQPGGAQLYRPGRMNDGVADQALYRLGQSVFSVSTQGGCLGAWRPESPLSLSALRTAWNSRPTSATRCSWAQPATGNRAISPSFPANITCRRASSNLTFRS